MTHLPSFIYESDKAAIILPVFFMTSILQYCDSVESCAYLY